MTAPELEIRDAVETDIPLILEFIRELADYEHLLHEVTIDEAGLANVLFGNKRRAEVVLGFAAENPVGFAVFFEDFSMYTGKIGMFLEDLYVRLPYRGMGYGKQLFEHVLHLAEERGCSGMEWSVFNWNQSSIDFYKKLGALPMSDWTFFRYEGTSLKKPFNGKF